MELNSAKDFKFSDGQPFDADDVVFTFAAILDEKVHSSAARSADVWTADRSLCASSRLPGRLRTAPAYSRAVTASSTAFYILPRHLLEAAWTREGRLAEVWRLATPPSRLPAGTVPAEGVCAPGQRITLERNPYYWKVDPAGHSCLTSRSWISRSPAREDNQVMRFQAGETDIMSRVSARNFAALEKDRGAPRLTNW